MNDQPNSESKPATPQDLVTLWRERERRYARAAEIALPGEETESDAASSEAYRTCAVELGRVLGADIKETSARYRAMIHATVERICVKRIEEIEGRVPTVEEVKEHGEMQVSERTGIVLYVWKGIPVCEYQSAGYKSDGWRDAIISEVRPAFVN